MRLTTLLTCFICLLAGALQAQLVSTGAYTQQWETQLRSPNRNNASTVAQDMQTDANGNIYTLTMFGFDVGQGLIVQVPYVSKHNPAGTLLWERQVGRTQLRDTSVQFFDFSLGAKLALDIRSNGSLEAVSITGQAYTEGAFGNLSTRLIYGYLIHLDPQTGNYLQNPVYMTDGVLGQFPFVLPLDIHYGGDGVAWVICNSVTSAGGRQDFFFSHNRATGAEQRYPLSMAYPNASFFNMKLAAMGNGYAIGTAEYFGASDAGTLLMSLNSQTGGFQLDSIPDFYPIDIRQNPTTQRVDALLTGLRLIELDSVLSQVAATRTHGQDTLRVLNQTSGNLFIQNSGQLLYHTGNPDPFILSLDNTGKILSISGTDRSNRGGLGAAQVFERTIFSTTNPLASIAAFVGDYGYGRGEVLYTYSEGFPGLPPVQIFYHIAMDLQNAASALNPPIQFTIAQDELFYSQVIGISRSNDRQDRPFPFASSPFGIVSARGHFGFHADSTTVPAVAHSYLMIENAYNISGAYPQDSTTQCHDGVTFAWSLPANICDTADALTLSAQPAGGVFSGTGVVTGVFDPSGLAAGSYTLTYSVATSPGCDTSFTRSITVVACSTGDSIPDSRANDALRAQTKLYPNPAQAVVTLALPLDAPATEVVLLTAQGQTVRRIDAHLLGAEVKIDLADLPAGLYYVRAITAHGTLSLPLQKL
jgi:hypothetical protein